MKANMFVKTGKISYPEFTFEQVQQIVIYLEEGKTREEAEALVRAEAEE